MKKNIALTLILLLALSLAAQERPEQIFASLGFAVPDADSPKYMDFKLESLSGEQISLSSFEGKVFLLNFWATWCGPCRAEMPSMERLYRKLKNSGLEIIAVNLEESKSEVRSFVKEGGFTFPVLLDKDGRVGTDYEASGIPLTYVFDRKGYLATAVSGAVEWDGPEIVRALELMLRNETTVAIEHPAAPDVSHQTAAVVSDQQVPTTGSAPHSAVNWDEGVIAFTQNGAVLHYDFSLDEVLPDFPQQIAAALPGVGFSGIDAALDLGDGLFYLFSGDQYVRFDRLKGRADAGFPRPIEFNLPGVTFDSIDAAVNNGRGKAYFFNGDSYIRFDLENGQADPGYPKSINEYTWPGLPYAKIDAAFSRRGKFFFFTGDTYVRFDIEKDEADPGYPKSIAELWPALEF